MKILLAVVAVVLVVAVIIVIIANSKPKSNLLEITSGEDLVALVNKIYEGKTENLPMLDTQILDFVNTPETAQYATDIEDFSDIEYAVASLPMMNAQAYSLTILKVKDGANVEEVAKCMNIDVTKKEFWIERSKGGKCSVCNRRCIHFVQCAFGYPWI